MKYTLEVIGAQGVGSGERVEDVPKEGEEITEVQDRLKYKISCEHSLAELGNTELG